MANLIRWDPAREMISMRNLMDHAFADLFSESPASIDGYGVLNLDMIQTVDDVIVQAAIPGVNPDDIKITIVGNTLTIRGETRKEEDLKESDYHIREMNYGAFARSVVLPCSVVTEKANAEFKNGVLKLTLPKAEEVKPKIITVKER